MTSFVFPGQGSQFLGMAKDFYDNHKIARTVFEEIQDYVGLNLKEIIFENKENLLDLTNFTQISIFTASVSIFRTFIDEMNFDLSKIQFMLGHSLGEYTALACSEKLNLKDCSIILKKRGDLMNNFSESNESGMAALIGKNIYEVENIINQNNIDLEIANDNSPIQVVVSGSNIEIDKIKENFLKNDVKKFVKLNVSSAFHSKFMNKAQDALNFEIDKLNLKSNDIKIISNYSAEISSENNVILNSLKNQMANRVRWTESIIKLLENGENQIIEIGPGKVLSGLIKRISNSFDIKTISNVNDLNS